MYVNAVTQSNPCVFVMLLGNTLSYLPTYIQYIFIGLLKITIVIM